LSEIPTYRKLAALLAIPAKRILNLFLASEEKPLCVFKNYESREAEVGNQNLSYIHFDKKISISDDDFRRRGYA